MAKAKSGGGPASKQNRNVGVRNGAPNKGVMPGWPAQQGIMQGSHATEQGKVGSPGPIKHNTGHAMQTPKYGNEIATRGLGVGGGRTVYKSGSQQGLKPITAPAQRGDILKGFGPEVGGRTRK